MLHRYMSIADEAEKLAQRISVDDVPEVIRFWYRDDSLRPLKALRTVICRLESEAECILFQTVLSATARRDANLPWRNQIAEVAGKHLQRFYPNVFTAFKRRALSAIKSGSELPPESGRCIYDIVAC